MKSLPELIAYYVLIDQYLETEWRSASSAPLDQAKIEIRQRLNDHAYFLLCWGQIEVQHNESCRDALRKRRANPDWTKRRGWDLYNPDEKRLSGLSFEDRVTLVLDKEAKSGEWKMVIKWYNLRNSIAHGGSYEQRIELSLVVSEFYQVQSAITT